MGLKTIGETLKQERTKKRLSIAALSVKTKIRRDFLMAIEKEEWGKLPEFPVVLGFVKNIAGSLGLDSNASAALLKRDYPPKEIRLNPKPDVSKKFVWSPRLTFWLGVFAVSIGVLGYLVYQYLGFVRPPSLTVEHPKEGQVVGSSETFVSGKTESDATIKINNQPAIVDDEGFFSAKIEVAKDTREIVVIANSRSGKETVVKVNISVDMSGD